MIPTVDRAQLILDHLGLVAKIVGQVLSRLSSTHAQRIRREDLHSAGVVGLIEAVDHYDPTRSKTLAQFAGKRIRGAILDCTRQELDLSKGTVHKASAYFRAVSQLRANLMRRPTSDEVRDALGLATGDDLNAYRQAAARCYPIPISTCDADCGFLDEGSNPEETAVESEQLQSLRAAAPTLPGLYQQVLHLRYFDGLTYPLIAKTLGITHAQVRYAAGRALAQLRIAIDPPLQQSS